MQVYMHKLIFEVISFIIMMHISLIYLLLQMGFHNKVLHIAFQPIIVQ